MCIHIAHLPQNISAPCGPNPRSLSYTLAKFTVYISRNYIPFRHVIKSETISVSTRTSRELHRGYKP